MGDPAVASYDSWRCADTGDFATVSDPLGQTTTRTYDTVSCLLTQTDPLRRLTWYTYDVATLMTLFHPAVMPRLCRAARSRAARGWA